MESVLRGGGPLARLALHHPGHHRRRKRSMRGRRSYLVKVVRAAQLLGTRCVRHRDQRPGREQAGRGRSRPARGPDTAHAQRRNPGLSALPHLGTARERIIAKPRFGPAGQLLGQGLGFVVTSRAPAAPRSAVSCNAIAADRPVSWLTVLGPQRRLRQRHSESSASSSRPSSASARTAFDRWASAASGSSRKQLVEDRESPPRCGPS
jgi:hypothetical protein